MPTHSEELLFGPDTTSTKPRPGLDSHGPKSESDTDRSGHDWGTSLPEINTSETFTVHWAQLPPPRTSTKSVFWWDVKSSRPSSSGTPTVGSTDPTEASGTGQSTTRFTGHHSEASADEKTDTLSTFETTITSLEASQTTPVAPESSAAAPALPTHTGVTSIGGSQAPHDGLLSSGETAAIVVSSFLAFSLCGVLGWFRWRHVKKRRAKAETDLDCSSLEPYQEGGLPMANTRAHSTTCPRAPSPTLPNIHCAQGHWGFNCEVPARSYTRQNMRGDGFRAGDPTIVELPGDYPQGYLDPDSGAADNNSPNLSKEGPGSPLNRI
ncbi:hypothetical protein CC79DRAFT_1319749 [Sarocladium strictum]